MKLYKFTALISLVFVSVSFASPFASEVVNFSQGPGASAGYNDPLVVLGTPPSADSFGWPINIDSAPWDTTDLVSLGNGGSITIKFDHQVINNPLDTEYGIDLLVFGNSMFATDWEGDGSIVGTFFEPAKVEVSQDGITFYEIANVVADALYPYTSLKGDFVYATPAGISYMGRQPADVVADYGLGCGGAQIDISSAIGTIETLAWIQYVRVTDVANDPDIADVVGFADVIPEPATMLILATGVLFLRKKNS